MAPVDVAMSAVLAVSCLVGVWRGFIYEAASLLGWVVAYFAAQHYAPWLMATWALQGFGVELGRGAAFALLFIAVLLAWALAAKLLRSLVQSTPLALPDRAVGAVFGLLRGLVLLLVVATVVAWTPLQQHEGWQASRGRVWLERLMDGLRPFLPDEAARLLPGLS